jgi:hypothetical protein
MNNYVCSKCGSGAYYDGRMGDGPILTCGCDKGEWVDEGSRGGYYHNPTGAKPIKGEPIPDYSREDD